MLLSFTDVFLKGHSRQGQPTYFEDKLNLGLKNHTFRFGHRFENNDTLQFWMGSPRNNGKPFTLGNDQAARWAVNAAKNPGHPHSTCPLAKVEDLVVRFDPRHWREASAFFIDYNGNIVDRVTTDMMAKRDGLRFVGFQEWMFLGARKWMRENGLSHESKNEVQAPVQIVHWTDDLYGLPAQNTFA